MTIDQAYEILYSAALLVLALLIAVMIFRSARGPGAPDRLLSINMIGTLVIGMILVLSALLSELWLVDVALLYKPEIFKVITSESIPYTFFPSRIDWSEWTPEEKNNFRTRDVLMVRGTIDGEMFAFFVTHLPSRLGGKGADLRPRGAEIIYMRAMELQKEFPGIKIVVMGDMNDNPTDPSMTEFLRGKEFIKDVTDDDFFDPFLSMIKAGYSSLYYQGAGNIFDIVMVNNALANAPRGTFQIQPIVQKKFYGRVFSKPFMTNQSGQYKDTPFRTFSGGAFVGGYSDHYPTYIVISK